MKADAKPDVAAPASNKKMMILVAVAALVVGAGAGGAWFFMHGAPAEKAPKAAKVEKSEYVPVESFVVNLQPEDGGEQLLQVQFTLQVAGLEQAEVMKTNMALVRNRVLLLLSGKRASEINTVEGKQALAGEILAAIKQPFHEKGEPQEVTDVLFTSFIIQ